MQSGVHEIEPTEEDWQNRILQVWVMILGENEKKYVIKSPKNYCL